MDRNFLSDLDRQYPGGASSSFFPFGPLFSVPIFVALNQDVTIISFVSSFASTLFRFSAHCRKWMLPGRRDDPSLPRTISLGRVCRSLAPVVISTSARQFEPGTSGCEA
jgi:hypothetical protein